MKGSVYVTRLGVVSAIGLDVRENLRSLLNMESGIRMTGISKDRPPIPVGKILTDNQELANILGLPWKVTSRTALLGIKAAREAWEGQVHRPGLKTGLISSTSVGGMDQSEKFYERLLTGENADFSILRCHENGFSTESIARDLGIRGYVNTLSTACSSAANAIILGARMIRAGLIDRVLAGGTDALTRFTINGFDSLMIYDSLPTRPFDESRAGLNLGEGAAFLLLESEESIKITGNQPIGKVAGWGNAADAYHQTASSPDGKGAALAIREAIAGAGLLPSDISYINLHGTGTQNNDQSESAALLGIFGQQLPDLSSTKAYTGHTLAAAGAIEAVFSLLAIQEGVRWPGLNFETPMEGTRIHPLTEPRKKPVDAVLSNSFGFGGNNSSLVFTRAEI